MYIVYLCRNKNEIMEFKGTKGRWETTTEPSNGDTSIDAIGIISNCEYQWDICAVWKDFGFEEEKPKYNALLISKAPEMLYLLNDLLHDKGINDVSRREIELLIKSATEIN